MFALLLIASPAIFDTSGTELLAEIRRSKEPIILVNVWATSCDPCIEELPVLVELKKAFAGRVRFVFVSTDFAASRQAAETVMTDHGVEKSWFKRGKDEPFMTALHPKWSGSLPATILFDKSGRRLELLQGKLGKAQLIEVLERHLAAR